jgi:cadmium resistance transport/sequestration family protein
MSELLTAFSTAVVAFVATNIDDILILIMFFSQVNENFRRRHIFIGQYLGFSLLLVASLPGFFGSLFVAPASIRLLGLVPIVVGLSSLLQSEEKDDSLVDTQSGTSPLNKWLSPQTCSVAAVTVANGGDNIGIYVPLFANSKLESLPVILGVFFALVGAWCYGADRLTSFPAVAHFLTDYGSAFVPCALIGLGVFIVKESLILAGIAIAASCLWLMKEGRGQTAEGGRDLGGVSDSHPNEDRQNHTLFN